MASLAERIAAAKAAQGAAQTAPTVAAALAPAPAPAPAAAPAPAPAVPQDQPKRQEPKDRGQGPRREERRAPPPPPAPTTPQESFRARFSREVNPGQMAKAGLLLPADAALAPPPERELPAVSSTPTPSGRYINPEETMRRVESMRLARLGGSMFAPPSAEQMVGALADSDSSMPFYQRAALQPRPTEKRYAYQGARPTSVAAAPESALQSVDAYRTELNKRGEQYQQLSAALGALAKKRSELEQIRAREGTAPAMATVRREPSPTERNLEGVARVAQDIQQKLTQARAGLQEMGLTEEQIKLYD